MRTFLFKVLDHGMASILASVNRRAFYLPGSFILCVIGTEALDV